MTFISALISRFWREILIFFVAGLVVAGVAIYGNRKYTSGFEDGKTEAQAQYTKQLEAVQKAQEVLKQTEVARYKDGAEERTETARKEYVEVEKTITRDVYIERDSLDDDGLQIINAAVARTGRTAK